MDKRGLYPEFCEIMRLTRSIGEALAAGDPEQALRLSGERQTHMNEIDRRRAGGEPLTDENRRQLSEILAADRTIAAEAAAQVEQYRQALAATRRFRQVKAYLKEDPHP